MIRLSNGHSFKYVVASGALGFDGLGWWWERPLVWLGIIRPELFTVVLKSLTLRPIKGNLNWWNPLTWFPWSPWSCVRFIPGGAVNKVGLTNPGFYKWLWTTGTFLDFKKYNLVASIFGEEHELVEMARMLDSLDFVAIEVNVSCPNRDHDSQTRTIVNSVKAVCAVTRHPVFVKVSVDQDYCAIARHLYRHAEAISLNSVPWYLFSKKRSPLRILEDKVGSGGGGVSGQPAQDQNWEAVRQLRKLDLLPVIAPSVMNERDVRNVLYHMHAPGVSFGTIHMRAPWRATRIVRNLC